MLVIFVLGLSLLIWNFAAPESLARTYGRLLGKPLEIQGLEMDYGRQTVTLRSGGDFEVNPAVPIKFTKLSSNRWRNYDLRLYSPDFDLQGVTAKSTSLSELLGDDYFIDPREFTVEVLDGSETKASFKLKAAFVSADWALMGDTAIEADKKIVYYRKALELDPDSEVLFQKLSDVLLAAKQTVALSELLEAKLAKDPTGPEADNLLNRLLPLYREQGDKAKEISVLERLLPLAESAGLPLEGLRTSLAALYREESPLKAAEIYESLIPESEPEHQLAYLNALIGIYRQESVESLEIAAWERLLDLVGPQEKSAVWTELLSLKEKTNDDQGLKEAWTGLADSLPDGPEKANAHKQLAYLWYVDGELVKAQEAYERALALDQTDSSLILNLARLALANKDRKNYFKFLNMAWELEKDPTLTKELAHAYAQDGLNAKAAELWLFLAERPGDDPATKKIQTEAKAYLLDTLRPRKGRFSAEFEKRLYQFSDNKIEFYNLGVAHFKAKHWDIALKAFQKAQELDTKNELANDIKGYLMALYKEKGQIKEMLDQAMLLYKGDPKFKESRDLVVAHLQIDKNWKTLAEAAGFWTSWHPDDPDNWRFLALGQRNSGQEPLAAKSLLKVAELEPTKANGWFTAAEALNKTGDKESARRAYEKVLELEPKNAKAESALLKLSLDALPSGGKKK
jgi:tetratricopeptide (TPR) repeat protein